MGGKVWECLPYGSAEEQMARGQGDGLSLAPLFCFGYLILVKYYFPAILIQRERDSA